MLWLMLLPFRLLAGLLALVFFPVVLILLPFVLLLWLPFKLLKLAVHLAIGLVALPFLLVLGVLGIVVGGLVAAVTALPFGLMALLVVAVWMLMRRPARAW